VDSNYTRHVRVARVHPANVRFAGRVIADVVSPRVYAKFGIVVQRTFKARGAPLPGLILATIVKP
jgi:hypothetical protein